MLDISKHHKDYSKLKGDSKIVLDMTSEDAVKARCLGDKGGKGSYLMKPVSYQGEDKENEMYDEHVYHSFLPENIVSDAIEEIVGVAFKQDITIKLPDKIKHLESHANNKGDSLKAVAMDLFRDLYMDKKGAISSDYDGDRSYIDRKEPLSIINWDMNSKGYTELVLSELYTDTDDEQKEQRRHYALVDGVLVVTVYRKNDNNDDWFVHVELDENDQPKPQPTLPNNEPYTYIPIRVPEVKKHPLLGMAKAVLKGFQQSANYYGSIHKMGSPNVALFTDKDVSTLNVGYERGIKLGQGDNVKLVGLSDDVINPAKESMENLWNSAIDQGIRLISSSGSTESGDALYLRNANKQIKVDSVANEASIHMEEALRVCAILEGASPDDVEFKINVELVEQKADIAELKEMREAAIESVAIKHSDYLIKMHNAKLITLEKMQDGKFDTDKYIKQTVEESKMMQMPEPELA